MAEKKPLLAGIRLGDEHGIDIHPQRLGIGGVQSMLGIDKGHLAPPLLGSLKFYSSVRIDIRRVESLKNGSEVIGNHVRAKIVKNKVAPPFRQIHHHHINGAGADQCLTDLQPLLAGIRLGEKDFGKGAVMRLGENAHVVVEAIPTGSLALDMALGIGGVLFLSVRTRLPSRHSHFAIFSVP